MKKLTIGPTSDQWLRVGVITHLYIKTDVQSDVYKTFFAQPSSPAHRGF